MLAYLQDDMSQEFSETDDLLQQAYRQEIGTVVHSGAIGFLIATFAIIAGPASAVAVATGMLVAAIASRTLA